MIRHPDWLIGTADVLQSSFISGTSEVRLGLGYYEGTPSDIGIGSSCGYWQNYGFASRPADPTKGAATALYVVDGDQKRVISVRDNRYVDIGQLKPGGSAQYGKTGSFQLIDGDNGTQTLYVPYAFDGNGVPQKAHAISLDVTNAGTEALMIVHGSGMAITMTAGGKNSVVLKNKAGDAYIEINDDGIVLNGNVTINGGIVAGNILTALPVLVGTPPGTPSLIMKVSPL